MTNSTLREVEGFVQVKPRGPVQAKGIRGRSTLLNLRRDYSPHSRPGRRRAGLDTACGARSEIVSSKSLCNKQPSGRGQILAMVGEPGMGKSRLVHEFTRHQLPPGWLVIEGASVSYGKATPYFPLIVMLRRYFQIADGEGSENVQERVAMQVLELDDTLRDTIAPVCPYWARCPTINSLRSKIGKVRYRDRRISLQRSNDSTRWSRSSGAVIRWTQ